jgi:hypothetical protein
MAPLGPNLDCDTGLSHCETAIPEEEKKIAQQSQGIHP